MSLVKADAMRCSILFVLLVSLAASTGCGDSNAAYVDSDANDDRAGAVTRLRVKAEPVGLGRLEGGGAATGTVRAFHRARITAETQGRVVTRVVEPGAELAEGEVLIELESTKMVLEVRRTEAAARAARTVRVHAETEFGRGEQLAAQSAISQQRQDDLRLALDRARNDLTLARVARDTAKRNLADTTIRAPFAGSVDSVDVGVGDYVSPGTPVATMVDLSRVRIMGGVTAREAARLAPGTVAKVSFADLGGRTFDATLQSVGRVANPADGTFGLELWLDNTEALMRDGLVARIELPIDSKANWLLARRSAMLRRNGRPEVFVVREEGGRFVARARVLETGRSDGDWIEVVDGLDSGDLVVVDGHFALEDGSVVELDGAAPSAGDTE